MKDKLTWLLLPISVAAFIATWGGWAKLASMTGYSTVEMLPGIGLKMNIGLTLPFAVEPFGMLAMYVALDSRVKGWARGMAGVMAISALAAAGTCQAVVHHLTVTGATVAPPEIVAVTSVLPVVVLGLGAGLTMLASARKSQAQLVSQDAAGTGFMGRLGTALGDAVASQAERLAVASQASRDMTQRSAQAGAGTASQASQQSVPAAPPAASQPPTRVAQDDVPAAQSRSAFLDLPREEQVRRVAELRLSVDPGTGKQMSYRKIGSLLGIGHGTAQRLGEEAEGKLPGTVDLTPALFGADAGTPAGTSHNGKVVTQ